MQRLWFVLAWRWFGFWAFETYREAFMFGHRLWSHGKGIYFATGFSELSEVLLGSGVSAVLIPDTAGPDSCGVL